MPRTGNILHYHPRKWKTYIPLVREMLPELINQILFLISSEEYDRVPDPWFLHTSWDFWRLRWSLLASVLHLVYT